MIEKGDLFSIKDGEVSSFGTRVMFGKQTSNKNLQKVVPELAVCLGEDGLNVIGEYIWHGGTLDDLWESQTKTLQFILDNIHKV